MKKESLEKAENDLIQSIKGYITEVIVINKTSFLDDKQFPDFSDVYICVKMTIDGLVKKGIIEFINSDKAQ